MRIRLLIADPDPIFAKEVAAELGLVSEIEIVGSESSWQGVERAIGTGRPEAVVFGPGWPKSRAINGFTELKAGHSALGAVLVTAEYSTELRRQAAEAGFAGVYSIPIDTSELLICLKSMAANISKQGKSKIKEGRIITIFSTKGGVGKTVVATNLAVALSEERQAKVVIVDMDLQFGDVGVMLKLMPKHTLHDLVGLKAVDIGQLQALLTPYDERVSAFVAPLQPELADLITPDIVAPIFGWLRQAYDYIIIDTPPSFNDIVLSVLEETDELHLISALDLPSLKNIKLCMHTLKLLEYSREKVHMALNRVDRNLGLAPAEVERVFSEQIAIQIPNDPAVAIAVNKGVPVVVDAPKSPASKMIVKFSESIGSSQNKRNERKVAQSVPA